MLISIIFISCSKRNVVYVVRDAPVIVNKSEILYLVNKARSQGQKCGFFSHYNPAPALKWHSQLEQAAQNHSNDMQENYFFSHTGDDGSDVKERSNRVGFYGKSYGENIAKGYPTEKRVVEGWLKSSGHCKNLMNPEYRYMGVATAGPYWTQIFGR